MNAESRWFNTTKMLGIDKIECGFAIHHATKLAGHGPDYR